MAPQTLSRTGKFFNEDQAIAYFEKLIELHSLILARAPHIHTNEYDLTPGEHSLLLSIISIEKSWTSNASVLSDPADKGAALAELLFRFASQLCGGNYRSYFVHTYFPLHFKFGLEEMGRVVGVGGEALNIHMDVDKDEGDYKREERQIKAVEAFYRGAAQRWLELETEWKMQGLMIGENLGFSDEENLVLQKWTFGYARELWAIA